MCSIIGARTIDKFFELYDLNSYRGTSSHSVWFFDEYNNAVFNHSGPKELDKEHINNQYSVNSKNKKIFYILGHSQAPTSKKANIHPAEYHNNFLWHNGIVKAKVTSNWDTPYILGKIIKKGWKSLSDIDGTFACFMYDANRSKSYIFRNEISPLFINDQLELSSSKYVKFHSLEWNTVFEMDFTNNKLIEVAKFTTKENPYYFYLED